MKTRFLYTIILLTCLVMASCEKLEEQSLKVTIDTSAVIFEEGETSRTVPYTVEGNAQKSCGVYVSGLDYVEATVANSSITFTPKGGDDFNETAKIMFADNSTSLTYSIVLMRNKAMSTETASYRFPEYARVFHVEIPEGEDYTADVSQGCQDWIKVKIGQNTDAASTGTRKCVFVLLEDNTGDSTREGSVSIFSPKAGKSHRLNITQLGAGMDGSLRKGLLDFYGALEGENWFKRAEDGDRRELHWNGDLPLLDFYGLNPEQTIWASKVDPGYNTHDKEVYFGDDDRWSLYLPFNGLKGTIPESFWDICKYFTSIIINNCYLQESTLSDKVWHENLEEINLWHTYINGTLSPAITNARNLKRMIFQKCFLTGELPREITSLRNIEYVDLKYCDIFGSLPDNIGDLTKLEHFNISGNLNFGGTLPDSFYNLFNLGFFNAADTKLGGTLSPRIGELLKLHNFWIINCEFEGKIPEETGTTGILELWVDNNYFTEIPEYVRYMGAYNRHDWFFGNDVFASGVPYKQRKKETGRPSDFVTKRSKIDVMTVDEYEDFPLEIDNSWKYKYILPMPTWAHMRYKTDSWDEVIDNEVIDGMIWPYAEDLEFAAYEYYYDKQKDAWCHPKLEYPAKEYYKNERGEWIHDASCPWEKTWVPEH